MAKAKKKTGKGKSFRGTTNHSDGFSSNEESDGGASSNSSTLYTMNPNNLHNNDDEISDSEEENIPEASDNQGESSISYHDSASQQFNPQAGTSRMGEASNSQRMDRGEHPASKVPTSQINPESKSNASSKVELSTTSQNTTQSKQLVSAIKKKDKTAKNENSAFGVSFVGVEEKPTDESVDYNSDYSDTSRSSSEENVVELPAGASVSDATTLAGSDSGSNETGLNISTFSADASTTKIGVNDAQSTSDIQNSNKMSPNTDEISKKSEKSTTSKSQLGSQPRNKAARSSVLGQTRRLSFRGEPSTSRAHTLTGGRKSHSKAVDEVDDQTLKGKIGEESESMPQTMKTSPLLSAVRRKDKKAENESGAPGVSFNVSKTSNEDSQEDESDYTDNSRSSSEENVIELPAGASASDAATIAGSASNETASNISTFSAVSQDNVAVASDINDDQGKDVTFTLNIKNGEGSSGSLKNISKSDQSEIQSSVKPARITNQTSKSERKRSHSDAKMENHAKSGGNLKEGDACSCVTSIETDGESDVTYSLIVNGSGNGIHTNTPSSCSVAAAPKTVGKSDVTEKSTRRNKRQRSPSRSSSSGSSESDESEHLQKKCKAPPDTTASRIGHRSDKTNSKNVKSKVQRTGRPADNRKSNLGHSVPGTSKKKHRPAKQSFKRSTKHDSHKRLKQLKQRNRGSKSRPAKAGLKSIPKREPSTDGDDASDNDGSYRQLQDLLGKMPHVMPISSDVERIHNFGDSHATDGEAKQDANDPELDGKMHATSSKDNKNCAVSGELKRTRSKVSLEQLSDNGNGATRQVYTLYRKEDNMDDSDSDDPKPKTNPQDERAKQAGTSKETGQEPRKKRTRLASDKSKNSAAKPEAKYSPMAVDTSSSLFQNSSDDIMGRPGPSGIQKKKVKTTASGRMAINIVKSDGSSTYTGYSTGDDDDDYYDEEDDSDSDDNHVGFDFLLKPIPRQRITKKDKKAKKELLRSFAFAGDLSKRRREIDALQNNSSKSFQGTQLSKRPVKARHSDSDLYTSTKCSHTFHSDSTKPAKQVSKSTASANIKATIRLELNKKLQGGNQTHATPMPTTRNQPQHDQDVHNDLPEPVDATLGDSHITNIVSLAMSNTDSSIDGRSMKDFENDDEGHQGNKQSASQQNSLDIGQVYTNSNDAPGVRGRFTQKLTWYYSHDQNTGSTPPTSGIPHSGGVDSATPRRPLTPKVVYRYPKHGNEDKKSVIVSCPVNSTRSNASSTHTARPSDSESDDGHTSTNSSCAPSKRHKPGGQSSGSSQMDYSDDDAHPGPSKARNRKCSSDYEHGSNDSVHRPTGEAIPSTYLPMMHGPPDFNHFLRPVLHVSFSDVQLRDVGVQVNMDSNDPLRPANAARSSTEDVLNHRRHPESRRKLD